MINPRNNTEILAESDAEVILCTFVGPDGNLTAPSGFTVWTTLHTSRVGNTLMMAYGIVRRVDDLNRIVIPWEIRRTLRTRECPLPKALTVTDGYIWAMEMLQKRPGEH